MKSSKAGNNILISSSEQYYDDCPICQAMRKAEKKGENLDLVEVAKAFNEANKMGAKIESFPEGGKHD